MKKIVLSLPLLLALALPLMAGAHQHATFKIGNSYYQFVVGSLNEPLVVDDKTGVDLTVNKCANSSCTASMGTDGDMDGPAGTAVQGLDQTLQVEISAAGKKKTFALSPQYGKPGAYSAPFYPTVATTLSYRFFGTVNGTNVDVTFTCLPEGTAKAADDAASHNLGGGVTQTLKAGAFGCPLEKAGLGFPEPSISVLSLSSRAASARVISIAALALSVIAFGLAVRRRS